MKITPALFEAYLKCPTKCWLRATGEAASGNAYAEWVNARNLSYRATETARLIATASHDEVALSPNMETVNAATWQFASTLAVQTEVDCCALESDLHAVERVPTGGRGKSAQFIPIHLIFRNKLGRDDKLLLAFDAVILSKALRREVKLGKIIHGDDHAVLKVKTAALAGEVQRRIEKLKALLTSPTPPDLVLNRHCTECEFQARCRQNAVEKDDLSLLSGITAQERKRLNNKGIFTVRQHSYAFLPRRRSKHLRNAPEKYHHSVKALAIRENKIHIVGSPELRIEGTPVFFDVEGIPDRDFYYLIGLHINKGGRIVEHSLWADVPDDEAKIYTEFLDIIKQIERPILVHYGSFETTFLQQMGKRYGGSIQEASNESGSPTAVNILQVILGRAYFPTYSNGLKDIAHWLGFAWSDTSITGVGSVAIRCAWEQSRDPMLKAKLVAYNVEDCRATGFLTEALLRLRAPDPWNGTPEKPTDAVYVESLKKRRRKFGTFVSPIQNFEQINLAAWWDYQRDRIKVRSRTVQKNSLQKKSRKFGVRRHLPTNRTITCAKLSTCPSCGGELIERPLCKRTLYDLTFGRCSVKRWIANYRFHYYWCPSCGRRYGEPREFWPQSHFGRNLIAYVLYQTIDLFVPFPTVRKMLSRCFKLDILVETLIIAKRTAARLYKPTYDGIFHSLVTGNLLHVDETQVSIRGCTAYVWVFTNVHDVAYFFARGREGDFLREMLKDFKGILVSDFYGVYDSLHCVQQKCLIHLMRDLNDDVLKHPYDDDLKRIVRDFADLLKPMIDTIDHRGLKRRFLGKHKIEVERFYRRLAAFDRQSERAVKCKQRFEKNRDKLFTFLNHDGIPWHNNNAEHAVKAFARIRDIVRGSFTERTVENSLVLLSICQSCNYRGLDFFQFLRSGEIDFYAFVRKQRGKRVAT